MTNPSNSTPSSLSSSSSSKVTGFFENIDANRHLYACLSKLAYRELRQSEEQATETKVSATMAKSHVREKTFTRLTKKMKTLYVLNVINRLRNQTVKFNVKKLFQIWLVYHRDDHIVKSICDIVFKNHTYDIARIREEILRRNQKLIKTKKQRDDNCRKICEDNELLRIFDKKCLNYCLRNFQCSIMELKKKIPTILCFNASDIDHIIETCKREKNFPIHFLPNSVGENVRAILNNRVPTNVQLTSTSATKI